MTTDTLILVKHSLPDVTAGVPPTRWRLGDEGRRRCRALAERLSGWLPAGLYSSPEPKASQTAALLAEAWHTDFEVREGLQEHDRSAHRLLPADAFDRAVRAVLTRPDEPGVLGAETGSEALTRFTTAVQGLVSEADGERAVVVTHGTVISLFVGAHNPVDPYSLWRSLDLPSLVVLSMPGFRLRHVVQSVVDGHRAGSTPLPCDAPCEEPEGDR